MACHAATVLELVAAAATHCHCQRQHVQLRHVPKNAATALPLQPKYQLTQHRLAASARNKLYVRCFGIDDGTKSCVTCKSSSGRGGQVEGCLLLWAGCRGW